MCVLSPYVDLNQSHKNAGQAEAGWPEGAGHFYHP